jgi:hypothetical protein
MLCVSAANNRSRAGMGTMTTPTIKNVCIYLTASHQESIGSADHISSLFAHSIHDWALKLP